MQRDIRETARFKDLTRRHETWNQVGTGKPVGFADVALSPDGKRIAGTCGLADKLEGMVPTRICVADVATGAIEILSSGPNIDRLPAWSPDGARLAYVSDHDRTYDFQVRIHDLAGKSDRKIAVPNAFAEYVLWSPDGTSLLIGAAGTGADLAGVQGATTTKLDVEAAPDWAPAIDTGVKDSMWRSLWLADAATGEARRISPAGVNIWEAAWCGADKVVAIASDAPGEEAWYTADVRVLDIASGAVRSVFEPASQLGWVSGSPNGRKIAFVEAVCSDRTLAAGDLKIVDLDSGSIRVIDSQGVDVSFTAWQGDDQVLYAGHRSFETEVALVDVATGSARALWSSDTVTIGGLILPSLSKGAKPGDFAFAKEGFFDSPQLCLFESGQERVVADVGPNDVSARVSAIGSVEQVRWNAPDGLEIHGWLLKPKSAPAPYPLILHVHGGPVWAWRPSYQGRSATNQALLEDGYAIFLPNPRGSSSRGQAFARLVFGDMGGADTYDYLSGLDALVQRGLADLKRIGVTGGSYGGFMSSWLITQDQRFAAAVPVAPVTNWYSEHFTCNVSNFCKMFVGDDHTNPGGKYFTHSPVFFAQNVKTPTLNICGALDRITPPTQAQEFHNALLANGVKSVLVTYPFEGHGPRHHPAIIDYQTRMLDWFETHMPAKVRVPEAAE